MVHGASQDVSPFYCPSCASVMLRVCVCGCVAKSPTHVDGVVGVADVADVANAHCQQKNNRIGVQPTNDACTGGWRIEKLKLKCKTTSPDT